MSWKRIWTMFKARNYEFFRDTAAFGWNFLFPFLIIAGFAIAFGGRDFSGLRHSKHGLLGHLEIVRNFFQRHYFLECGHSVHSYGPPWRFNADLSFGVHYSPFVG